MDTRALTGEEKMQLEAERDTCRKQLRRNMAWVGLIFVALLIILPSKGFKDGTTLAVVAVLSGLIVTLLVAFYYGAVRKLEKDIAEGIAVRAVLTVNDKILNREDHVVVLRFAYNPYLIDEIKTDAATGNKIPLFDPVEVVYAPHSKKLLSYQIQ